MLAFGASEHIGARRWSCGGYPDRIWLRTRGRALVETWQSQGRRDWSTSWFFLLFFQSQILISRREIKAVQSTHTSPELTLKCHREQINKHRSIQGKGRAAINKTVTPAAAPINVFMFRPMTTQYSLIQAPLVDCIYFLVSCIFEILSCRQKSLYREIDISEYT